MAYLQSSKTDRGHGADDSQASTGASHRNAFHAQPEKILAVFKVRNTLYFLISL